MSFDVTFPGGGFGVIEGQVTGRRPGSPCHLGVSSEASRGGDVHLWEAVDSGTHHLHGWEGRGHCISCEGVADGARRVTKYLASERV